MKKSTVLTASLILGALVLGACGTITVNVPRDAIPTSISITVPTELPGVTIAPPTSPPQDTAQPIVPVTGSNPGGPTTIIFWGVVGFIGLLILIALIALLTRPTTIVEGPRSDGEVVEREVIRERRDDLP